MIPAVLLAWHSGCHFPVLCLTACAAACNDVVLCNVSSCLPPGGDDGGGGGGGAGDRALPEVGTNDPIAFQTLLRSHTTCRATKLGAGRVDAPNSKVEVMRLIAKECKAAAATPDGGPNGRDVLLCIPRLSGGYIYVVDNNTYEVLEQHKIKKILFCSKGTGEGGAEHCIGFTNHVLLEGEDGRIRSDSTLSRAQSSDGAAASAPPSGTPGLTEAFLCHVFQFPGEAKTEFALTSIAQAFGNGPDGNAKAALLYEFDAVLWMSEHDPSKEDGFAPCQYSFSKGMFKLHPTEEPRQISVQLTQTSKQRMIFGQGFGLMLGAGRTDDDMAAVEMSSCEKVSDQALRIVGKWNPPTSLTKETAKDSPNLQFVLAIDVTLNRVSEPLRLKLTFQVRVNAAKERFLHASFKKAQKGYSRSFHMQLNQQDDDDDEGGSRRPKMFTMEYTQEQKVTQRGSYMQRMKQLARLAKEPDSPAIPDDDVDEDVDPDSMNHPLSGMGTVTKEMTESIIDLWADVLSKWETVPRSKIRSLARKGIPDALRHQVWKRLVTLKSEGLGDDDLFMAFPHLIKKESETEKVIRWDLNRTFPGNEFFAKPAAEGGEGQMRLFRVCKAYSVYDEEIGYCQGLSFIVAVLLLHMPDEDAFVLFVKLMYDYGVREMFKAGFADLQLKFYQLYAPPPLACGSICPFAGARIRLASPHTPHYTHAHTSSRLMGPCFARFARLALIALPPPPLLLLHIFLCRARLIEELLPDLHEHFKELGIETHMFASQWFLTLFAAKFPLVTAYRVVDVLLSEGIMVLYQISMGTAPRPTALVPFSYQPHVTRMSPSYHPRGGF